METSTDSERNTPKPLPEPEIILLPVTLVAGRRMTMSLSLNRTRELWQSFMPLRNSIPGRKGPELYSIQIYDPAYFTRFDPQAQFEKWAAAEVDGVSDIPAGMELLTIPAGLYAVFLYKGRASAGPEVFNYIFTGWLPASGYLLDDRPHFEKLGERYKNEDPGSEEEIWIPVKKKQ